jgi:hypothetical protein
MHDRVPNHRHTEETALGLLDAFLDRSRDLARLAVADADLTGPIAHDHERGEGEPSAALYDLGDAVDRNDSLFVLGAVVVTPSASSSS